VVDNAGVGQMISLNGLGWRSIKWLQQRKIVITGEGYYAPPTLLMEEGTERRRRRLMVALMLQCCVFSVCRLSVQNVLWLNGAS